MKNQNISTEEANAKNISELKQNFPIRAFAVV
jgi:hypothetical protein